MKKNIILLSASLLIITLNGCDFKNYKSENFEREKTSSVINKNQKNQQDSLFIASFPNTQIIDNVFFLDKEVPIKIRVKDNCLSVHLEDDSNKDYLLILNKKQKVIYNSNGGLEAIQDTKTNKTIKLNTKAGIGGVSFESSKVKFNINPPENCPNEYIILGDFL